MSGRRIRDERDARDCLRAAEASGLERAVWARMQGINPRSLNAWRVNLERDDARGGGMLELVPTASRPCGGTYTVRCGPFSVEVDEAFDEGVLSRLLAVVAAC